MVKHSDLGIRVVRSVPKGVASETSIPRLFLVVLLMCHIAFTGQDLVFCQQRVMATDGPIKEAAVLAELDISDPLGQVALETSTRMTRQLWTS